MITVEVDLGKFKIDMKKNKMKLASGIREISRRVGERLQTRARNIILARGLVFTGALRDSILLSEITSDLTSSSWRMGTILPYAVAVEYGVKPHLVPVHKHPGLESWISAKAPHLIGAHNILIGGARSPIRVPGAQFIFTSFNETLPEVPTMAETILKEAITKI